MGPQAVGSVPSNDPGDVLLNILEEGPVDISGIMGLGWQLATALCPRPLGIRPSLFPSFRYASIKSARANSSRNHARCVRSAR